MSDESFLIDKWIFDRLAGDATILAGLGGTAKIYEGLAPQGATYPFIVYQNQSPPRDVRGVGTTRIMVDSLYLIKVLTPGNYAAIKSLADRIDVLFHGIQTETAYVRIVASVRESTFRLVEVREQTTYRHRGSVFRIQAQSV